MEIISLDHLCFPILWQLGRPINHALELNSAHWVSESKPPAPISLATAEPFQNISESWYLDHVIPISFWEPDDRIAQSFVVGLLGENYATLCNIPDLGRLSQLRDAGWWRSRTLRRAGTFHVAARRWGPWVWRSKCNRLRLTVVEVISEFELLCSVVTLVLVHSWFFSHLFRRIGFLAEFWVNINGWLRRPWSGAADGFAQTILWGSVQLYLTDFVSGPTCSQAWLLEEQSEARFRCLSSHSIGQFGPLPDLKGILDDLGKDQRLQQHPARQFREPVYERMMGSFDLSGSAAMFADAEIDSVAILMSPGCESQPLDYGRVAWGFEIVSEKSYVIRPEVCKCHSSSCATSPKL